MHARLEEAQGIPPQATNRSTIHPGSDTRSSKPTYVLQTGAAHGEIADEVPDQGNELEDGGDKSEEERLKLERTKEEKKSARVSEKRICYQI